MLPGMQQRGCSGEPCGIQLCNDSDQRQTSGGLRFKKSSQPVVVVLPIPEGLEGRPLIVCEGAAEVQPNTRGNRWHCKDPHAEDLQHGHLSIPQEMRQKRLNDPIRSFSFDPYAVFCVCCFLGSN